MGTLTVNKLDSDSMSMWILKSPVLGKAFSRKEENSSKNVKVTVGWRAEYGGLYITMMRIHLFPIEIVQSAD